MTLAMTFDERYRAIDARDARFDGQFITTVLSTGIYCRPSCPARTPKPKNVTFFLTSAAAHEAGFRACKRCLPEAAPGSPEWNTRSDAAGRAMRLIAEGVVEREGVAGLAARLGYSSRHLGRLLHAELGAGPLALARAQRAHTARMLLVGSDIPISTIAFSAGFTSVRQFNDTIREVFGMPPTQLRARAGAGPGRVSRAPAPNETSDATPIQLSLPFRGPLDHKGIFAWLSARALPGVEVASDASYARTLMLPGGLAWFRVQLDGEGLQLAARLSELRDLPVLVARVRRLFDLDADPLAIDAELSKHPELLPLVANVSGIRVPGTTDPAELLIRTMVGQQITVVAARTALSRLVEELGESTTEAFGCNRRFPSMAAIAERGAEVLRGPAFRIRAITEAAEALATGELQLSYGDEGREQREVLLARRGIGPWTADYVRMRVTGDPDVFLPGDVAVRSGAAAAGLTDDARAIDEWSRRASPWRSYLTAHFWRNVPSTKEKS